MDDGKSRIDEEFDRNMLRYLEAEDARGMAEYFDGYSIPHGDNSQNVSTRGAECTGMPSPGGPQGGTRETCTWIAAASVCAGHRWTVVDYVPLYASPIGVSLYKDIGFDLQKDLVPVAITASAPGLFNVHAVHPANTLKELIESTRAKGATLNYATAGVGTSSHLAAEYLFRTLAGIKVNHI